MEMISPLNYYDQIKDYDFKQLSDEKSRLGEYLGNEPNATCKKCGRVQMPFCTWGYDEVEDAYLSHIDIYA